MKLQTLTRLSAAAIALLAASSPRALAGVNRWTTLGPRSSAVVNTLARDPSAADTVYAGTSGGGVFKSEDGGETWAPARLGLSDRSVTALVFDPTVSGAIYAATDAGVFKTSSAGATWTRASEAIATESFTCLAIDPAHPSKLYAGTVNGVIYGTADGGKTWSALFTAPPFTSGFQGGAGTLAVDAGSAVYLTTHFGGVYRSIDAGKTWLRTNVTSGSTSYYTSVPLVVDPTGSTTAYFGLDRALYKTTDGGATWRTSGPNITTDRITTIALSPDDPKTIVVGTTGNVYRSRDAGGSWTSLGAPAGKSFIRALGLGGGSPSAILAARGATLVKAVAESNDPQWRLVTEGLDAASISALSVSPLDRTRLLAFDGFDPLRSADGGKNWLAAGSGGPSFFYNFTFSPLNSSTALAGTSSGTLLTEDGGTTWQSTVQDSRFFGTAVGFSFHPTQRDIVYAATDAGVQKSSDGGRHWSSTGAPLDQAYAVLVDQLNPSTIYATHLPAAFYYGPFAVTVEKSADGGVTWNDSDSGFDALRNVTALAIDPVDTKTLYAAVAGKGVYRTSDGAASWKWVSADLLSRVSTLLIDPSNRSILYAGTDRGLFRSRDAATSWSAFSSGLTNRAVTSLTMDATGRWLYAGTAGGGVFGFELLSGPLDVSVARNGDTRFPSFDPQTGRFTLGRADPSGRVSLSVGFGPFEGWTPRALAEGTDGVTRVLWTHENGSAALWLVGTGGASFLYPSQPGLDAVDVAAGPGSQTHVLWAGIDGAVLLRTIDGSGGVVRDLSLGPYRGWTAVAIDDGPDVVTRLLWRKRDGSAGLSLVSADGIRSTRRYDGAPGWTAVDVAVGGDGLARILWAHDDGRAAVGRVNAAGEIAYSGVRTAPPGLTATRIAAAPDGSSRVLLTGSDRAATLWVLSPEGALLGTIALD